MTASVTKPRTRKRAFPKTFDTAYLRKKGRRIPGDDGAPGMPDDMGHRTNACLEFDEAFEQLSQFAPDSTPSALEMKVTTFFSRLERVTVHILDRLGTLALKGAAYIDSRG